MTASADARKLKWLQDASRKFRDRQQQKRKSDAGVAAQYSNPYARRIRVYDIQHQELQQFLKTFGLHGPVLDAIHPQLEHEIRTFNLHVQFKVQVVELDALGRREAREETLRHIVQVGSESTDRDEVLAESVWSIVEFAADEVVLNDKGLSGSEVARVVEGNWLICRDGGTLHMVNLCCSQRNGYDNAYLCNWTPIPIFDWMLLLVEYSGVAAVHAFRGCNISTFCCAAAAISCDGCSEYGGGAPNNSMTCCITGSKMPLTCSAVMIRNPLSKPASSSSGRPGNGTFTSLCSSSLKFRFTNSSKYLSPIIHVFGFFSRMCRIGLRNLVGDQVYRTTSGITHDEVIIDFETAGFSFCSLQGGVLGCIRPYRGHCQDELHLGGAQKALAISPRQHLHRVVVDFAERRFLEARQNPHRVACGISDLVGRDTVATRPTFDDVDVVWSCTVHSRYAAVGRTEVNSNYQPVIFDFSAIGLVVDSIDLSGSTAIRERTIHACCSLSSVDRRTGLVDTWQYAISTGSWSPTATFGTTPTPNPLR
ncbi:hypothetical protein KC360_g202 [Hortaea werneckii]|nr:hypothetical protein KC360_g202 [Hortaea werneckii]